MQIEVVTFFWSFPNEVQQQPAENKFKKIKKQLEKVHLKILCIYLALI